MGWDFGPTAPSPRCRRWTLPRSRLSGRPWRHLRLRSESGGVVRQGPRGGAGRGGVEDPAQHGPRKPETEPTQTGTGTQASGRPPTRPVPARTNRRPGPPRLGTLAGPRARLGGSRPASTRGAGKVPSLLNPLPADTLGYTGCGPLAGRPCCRGREHTDSGGGSNNEPSLRVGGRAGPGGRTTPNRVSAGARGRSTRSGSPPAPRPQGPSRARHRHLEPERPPSPAAAPPRPDQGREGPGPARNGDRGPVGKTREAPQTATAAAPSPTRWTQPDAPYQVPRGVSGPRAETETGPWPERLGGSSVAGGGGPDLRLGPVATHPDPPPRRPERERPRGRARGGSGRGADGCPRRDALPRRPQERLGGRGAGRRGGSANKTFVASDPKRPRRQNKGDYTNRETLLTSKRTQRSKPGRGTDDRRPGGPGGTEKTLRTAGQGPVGESLRGTGHEPRRIASEPGSDEGGGGVARGGGGVRPGHRWG